MSDDGGDKDREGEFNEGKNGEREDGASDHGELRGSGARSIGALGFP